MMILAAWCALTVPSTAKDIAVSARIDRSSLAVGNAALLTVTIQGNKNAQVQIPEIEGLFIEGRGHSTNIQFGNGQMTSSITKRYIVRPSKEGDYTIGPITIESDGKKLTVQNSPQLKVTKGAAPGKAGSHAAPSIDLKNIAHIEISGLKKQALVGELIPIKIHAFFKQSEQISLASVQSKPTLDGSAFTVKHADDKTRRGPITKDGQSYYVIIFKAAISPIKPGEFELPFTMDATMRIREQPPQRRRRTSGFNDPFLNSFFARSVQKSIHVTSKPFKIKVSTAPTENQPAGFNGAIGQFTLTATAPSEPIRAGDPLTLTIKVSGNGNLSRLKSPSLIDGSSWKTYPAKDHIIGGNALGSSGTKVFEQTIVPRNPSVTEIPGVALSYFDPEKGTYQTIRTQPLPIQVLPGTNIEETQKSKSLSSTEKVAPSSTPNSIHDYLGWLRKDRLNQSRWFILGTIGTSGAILLLGLGIFLLRCQNTQERGVMQKYHRDIKSCLQQMDHAINQNDPSTFFQQAQRAIQIHWSKQLDKPSHSITGSDVLNSDSQAVFEMADNLAFSGELPNDIDLQPWKNRTLNAIGHSH